MGLPGVSIPQGFAVTEVPIALFLDKLYDKITGKKAEDTKDANTDKINQNRILNVLKDPLFLGLLIGLILAFSVGYGFKDALNVGINMAALMFLLPRMVKILMEGLLPISQAAQKKMSKRYNGEELYIGMDSAILLGHPTTLAVGLLLIPITLVLAMLLPGNTVLPVADLASTAYFISMATIIHKGKFGRTLITGTVIMAIVLLIASYFAPQITNFAASGAVSIPDGAASISALSAGNIYAFLINLIFKTTWLGLIICLVIIVTLIIWNKKYLASKESKAETAIVNGTDAETYLNK